MKCIVHIGTPKTGTKTIQSFLILNRELLKSHKVYFTKSLGFGADRALSLLCYPKHRGNTLSKSFGLLTDIDLDRFKTEKIELLKRELNELNILQSETVLFSSEDLQYGLDSPQLIHNLKNLLGELGFSDFKIVLYIRNPESFSSSFLSARVKAGLIDNANLLPPDDPTVEKICNHRLTIDNWSSVFGLNSLSVRVFDKNHFVNNNLIDDFIFASELPVDEKYAFPARLNQSLTMIGAKLLASINRIIPRFIDNRENPERQDIVEFFETLKTADPLLPANDLLEEYRNYYREPNKYVCDLFF